jgi:Tol biopolymer transport system component
VGILERNRDNRITILTDHPHLTTRIPNWSHDGRRIAFHRWDQRDPKSRAQIFVAEVVFPSNGGPPRLANEMKLAQRVADNTDVTWYVNDRYVLTASGDDSTVNVWAVPVDGGAEVQLTHHTGQDTRVAAPRCSPDGRWLVYEFGEPARLMMVPLPWRELGGS